MKNVIIIFVLAVIVSGIIWYLIRAKRKGEKCIGCPYAKQCNNQNNSCNCSEK